MFRGRVRKFCLEKERNVLVENSENGEEEVYFAIPTGEDPREIIQYIETIIPSANILLAMKAIPNPVLSKAKVNDETRYTL